MKKSEQLPVDYLNNRLEILKEIPERSSAAAEHGRAKFLAQARIMRASLSEPVPWWERIRSYLNGLVRPLPALSWVVAAVVALVMFFGGSSATVYASQSSLPGDNLYSLKLLSEDSRLFFTITPAAKLNLSLDLADRRMDEISRLQNAGRPIPSQTIDHLRQELDRSFELAAKMKDPQMRQSLQLVAARVDKQLKVLDAMMAGKAANPALANVNAMLVQLEEQAALGQADPLAFRNLMLEKFNQAGGKPENTPTNTLTATETNTPTSTNTFTPTSTSTGTITETSTPTLTSSPTATYTPTPTATKTRAVRTRKPTHTPRPKPNTNPY